MTRTNATGVLTILIRAGALWLAVNGAFAVATGLATGTAEHVGYGAMATIYALLFALAGVLWLCADLVARASFADPRTPLFESDLDLAQWQRLAFSVVGLWLAVQGLLDCVGNLLRMRFAASAYPDEAVDLALGPEIALGVLRLLLGVGLLFGARGLVALVTRMRGREPSGSATDDSAPPP